MFSNISLISSSTVIFSEQRTDSRNTKTQVFREMFQERVLFGEIVKGIAGKEVVDII